MTSNVDRWYTYWGENECEVEEIVWVELWKIKLIEYEKCKPIKNDMSHYIQLTRRM